MNSKIYKVTRDDGALFLVEANSRPAAVNYIARASYSATLASQRDLIHGMRAGIPIQRAGAPEGEEESVESAGLTV